MDLANSRTLKPVKSLKKEMIFYDLDVSPYAILYACVRANMKKMNIKTIHKYQQIASYEESLRKHHHLISNEKHEWMIDRRTIYSSMIKKLTEVLNSEKLLNRFITKKVEKGVIHYIKRVYPKNPGDMYYKKAYEKKSDSRYHVNKYIKISIYSIKYNISESILTYLIHTKKYKDIRNIFLFLSEVRKMSTGGLTFDKYINTWINEIKYDHFEFKETRHDKNKFIA